ncbi:hypothetical protein HPB47_010021 [Ixodes persulcatus]|uniref:Uncharacterized protein n=1 Tax=Ixodes persulcatus TaxID=34615 RepID=A0AC60P069_IXOPE|nr:hypothetical protein HPB47_010021 [Ixodes persulcatus]
MPDDVSLWTTKAGSSGWIQETLQAAADVVEKYARGCGLRCSLQKSELVVVQPRAPKKHTEEVNVVLEDKDTIPGSSVKILVLAYTTEQILHMLRRVANRQRGMKEADTLKLVQAFIILRVTYAMPYLLLSKGDTKQVDIIIRKAVKQAIGVPVSASTNKLLEMGIHNTVDELIEGHLSSQRKRLSQTQAGRQVLQKIGRSADELEERGQLADDWQEKVKTKPIPKNMNPACHGGRSETRARALTRQLGNGEDVVYKDASKDQGTIRAVAVVKTKEKMLTSLSLEVKDVEEAKEMAIALALTMPGRTRVVTDSQHAYRSFQSIWASRKVLRVLKNKRPPKEPLEVVWLPAHSTVEGTELAHQQACVLT